LRTLKPEEAKTLEAVGEALCGCAYRWHRPIRRSADFDSAGGGFAGGAHHERGAALCEFLSSAIGAIDRASKAHNTDRGFADLDAIEQHQSSTICVRARSRAWQAGAPFVYFLLRTDAVDVVYGTMEGMPARVPYMPHIAPTREL